MERITSTHIFFWDGPFSNWHDCKFRYKEKNFSNSEQAFMWEKALFFKDFDIAEKILTTPNPRDNKALGRKIKGFDAEKWAEVSFNIMVDVNMAKFSQNLQLKHTLISTKNKTLVEASPVDTIWGIGLHWDNDDVLDESKWRGQNLLGKALIEVRKKINEIDGTKRT